MLPKSFPRHFGLSHKIGKRKQIVKFVTNTKLIVYRYLKNLKNKITFFSLVKLLSFLNATSLILFPNYSYPFSFIFFYFLCLSGSGCPWFCKPIVCLFETCLVKKVPDWQKALIFLIITWQMREKRLHNIKKYKTPKSF